MGEFHCKMNVPSWEENIEWKSIMVEIAGTLHHKDIHHPNKERSTKEKLKIKEDFDKIVADFTSQLEKEKKHHSSELDIEEEWNKYLH